MSGKTSGAFCALSCLLCLVLGQAHAGILHVKANAAPGGDGSSWATPLASVQAAVNAAGPGDEVWVATGTYIENVLLKAGVGLYGGFAGNETSHDQRNQSVNPTVLDGNRAGTVVFIPNGAGPDTVLSSFTIRNGTGTPVSDASGDYSVGGGVVCASASATISLNVITANTVSGSSAKGAGLYVDGKTGGTPYQPAIYYNTVYGNTSPSSTTAGGVYFTGNTAPFFAANIVALNTVNGVVSRDASPVIASNLIYSNNGDGININNPNSPTTSTVSNNTIVRNEQGGSYPTFGNGILCMGNGTVNLANNIIAFNGIGGVYASAVTLNATHNDIYGNTGTNFKTSSALGPPVPDPIGQNGNISSDPRFASVPYSDYRIRPDSPCKDTGDNASVGVNVDIEGQVRTQSGTVDMGADESDGTSFPNGYNVVRVSPAGNDADDGST